MSPTRFIAKYGSWSLKVVDQVQEAYATGMVRVIQPEIVAQFAPFKLTPFERELALNSWTFNGSYQEMDEVTTVPPDYRIGVFDSREMQEEKGWSDEVRKLVEDKLIERCQVNDDVIFAHKNVPPPWPRYDDFRGTPQALARKLVEDGHDLEAVLAYEQDNQARPKIIEEIEKAIAAPPAPSEAYEEVVG